MASPVRRLRLTGRGRAQPQAGQRQPAAGLAELWKKLWRLLRRFAPRNDELIFKIVSNFNRNVAPIRPRGVFSHKTGGEDAIFLLDI
jgi:hypothetical protein